MGDSGAMIVFSNRTTSMNSTPKLISRFTIIVILAGSFCAAAAVWAQSGANPQDFQSVSENPFLRHATSKPKTSATAVPKKLNLSAGDQKFLTSALGAGVWEVDNGRAAESRAQHADTKRVAANLVAENSRINQEIVDLAKKKGLGLSPRGSGAQKLPAAHYDKDYLTLAKQDHQENIRVFEKQAKSGHDPELRQFAARTLPGLKHQLGSVEEALGKVK
jgi:putative membrane protein